MHPDIITIMRTNMMLRMTFLITYLPAFSAHISFAVLSQRRHVRAIMIISFLLTIFHLIK